MAAPDDLLPSDRAVRAGTGSPGAVAFVPVPFLQRRDGSIVVVLLLSLGGFVLNGLGLVLGLVLLWRSPAWTRVDKLVGTFATPLLLAAAVGVSALLYRSPPRIATDGGFQAPQQADFGFSIGGSLLDAAPFILLAVAAYLLVRFRPAR